MGRQTKAQKEAAANKAAEKETKFFSVSDIATMLTDGYEDSEDIARKVLAKDVSAEITKEEITQVMAHGLQHYCAFVSSGLEEINILGYDQTDKNIDSLFEIIRKQFSI